MFADYANDYDLVKPFSQDEFRYNPQNVPLISAHSL